MNITHEEVKLAIQILRNWESVAKAKRKDQAAVDAAMCIAVIKFLAGMK